MEKRTLDGKLVRMRPLESADISQIQEFASAKEIADNTFVPHPYPPDGAQTFVDQAIEHWSNGEGFTFAILDKTSALFAGCMGIHPVSRHNRAEVGYWIGKPYWGRGLATAALRLLIQFGFGELGLNRIEAGHFVHNAASARVMQKAGMRCEGLRRAYVAHGDGYKDLVYYTILRSEFEVDSQERP